MASTSGISGHGFISDALAELIIEKAGGRAAIGADASRASIPGVGRRILGQVEIEIPTFLILRNAQDNVFRACRQRERVAELERTLRLDL